MAKIFVSHAWEDKFFAKPLADALKQHHNVWFDEYSLNIGDSLRAKIDEGLATCDFGVVVLSHHFFNKNWTQNELDGLMALQRTHRKMILPIWLDIAKAEVERYSPMLAGRIASLASKGVELVVEDLNRSISASEQQRQLDENKKGREALLALVKSTKGKQYEEQIFSTVDGVVLFNESLNAIFREIESDIEHVNKTGQMFRYEKKAGSVAIHGPKLVSIHIGARDLYLNSVRSARLAAIIYVRSDYSLSIREGSVIDDIEYFPMCRGEGEFCWKFGENENPRTNRDISQDILRRYSKAVSEAVDDAD